MQKGPNVSPTIAATIVSLIVGVAAGYYTRYFSAGDRPTANVVVTPPGPSGGAGGYGGGGMRGGGGGGYGGGGRGGPPTGGAALARLVRNLDTIESVQGKGLKPDQAKTLLPLLNGIKSAATLSPDEADKQVAAIQNVLTPDQKTALDSLQPQGGGRGGGGYGGGMGGPPGGAPGGGRRGGPMSMGGPPGGGGGGYGGGNRPDPNKPFANERNEKALENLIASIGKGGKG